MAVNQGLQDYQGPPDQSMHPCEATQRHHLKLRPVRDSESTHDLSFPLR